MAGILSHMPQHRNTRARRKSYAIQIIRTQQNQEQFAFRKFEFQDEFARKERRVGTEFGLQPITECQ